MHVLHFLLRVITEKAFAADSDVWSVYCSAFGSSCGGGSTLIEDLAGNAAQLLFMLIGGGAVVSVIIAGLKIVFSGGNDGKLEEGKKIITYAAIGIALATSTWAILELVQSMVE